MRERPHKYGQGQGLKLKVEHAEITSDIGHFSND